MSSHHSDQDSLGAPSPAADPSSAPRTSPTPREAAAGRAGDDAAAHRAAGGSSPAGGAGGTSPQLAAGDEHARGPGGVGGTAASSSAGGPARTGAVQYREKLTVAWWTWLVVAFVGGAGFVAVAPISITAGVVVAVVLVVAIAVAVALGTPSIELTDEALRVGRAYIEREYVGRAEALRGKDARAARGPELDGRAFMNFRVSVPDLCRIRIEDPVDPTPYWLTATRHPEELARAVNDGLVDAPSASPQDPAVPQD